MSKKCDFDKAERAIGDLIDYILDGRMEPVEKEIEEAIDIANEFLNEMRK